MPKTVTPLDDPTRDNWYRYQYMRDSGHREFVTKARVCEDYVAGIQWDESDLATLRESGRPAMTINKILSTVDHLSGEQLFNRAAIAYRPSRGMANAEVADALTKTHMNIAHANRLSWTRSDVFCDGVVTGRGYFDVRINVNSNFMGDIIITRAPSESILLDPDASEYDPDTWHDVGRSNWVSLQEIEVLYGARKAKELAPIEPGYSPYEFTDDDFVRDGTFAAPSGKTNHSSQIYYPFGVQKFFRTFERQYYVLTSANVFVDTVSGEIVPIPHVWDHNRISSLLESNPDVHVMKKQVKKIRWSVTAGPVVLHDEWSPYKHFSIIPFFPHFRQGRTHGIVEHLIGPQQILNKTRSQELHVINTSANSGWVVEEHNLVNMTERQLETTGAQTGLVIVVKNKDGIEKIKPNQVPTGLDRVSFKTEEDLKNISGVSDNQTGFAREDVSGKAIRANQAAGSTSFAPLFDRLARTDNLLASRVLNLIQTFFTEPRLLHIIGTKPGVEDEQLMVNAVGPEGQIINDLGLGEYEVVVTSEPDRDTYEDMQFEHAKELMELGIQIPPAFMIRASKLREKTELLQEMDPVDPEEEAFQAQLAKETQLAELEILRGDAQNKQAEALLKSVRAASEKINLETTSGQGMSPEKSAEAKVDMMKENQKHQNSKETINIEFMHDIEKMREQHLLDKRLQASAPKPAKAPATK